jgi:hypothetical protein
MPDGENVALWHLAAERAYQRFSRYGGLSRHWPTSPTRIAAIGTGTIDQNLLLRANLIFSRWQAMSLAGEGGRSDGVTGSAVRDLNRSFRQPGTAQYVEIGLRVFGTAV